MSRAPLCRHQALNYLTPLKFLEVERKSRKGGDVSLMYWTSTGD